MALAVIKSGTKVGLAGGAFYWSVQQGIWGSMNEGSEAMKRLKSTIIAPVADEPEKVSKPVEKTGGSVMLEGWNNGVKTVFGTVSNVPEYCHNAGQKASSSIKNLINGD